MIVLVDYEEAAQYFATARAQGDWSVEAQAIAGQLQSLFDVDERIRCTLRFGGPGRRFVLMLALKARGELLGVTVDVKRDCDPRMIAAALDRLVHGMWVKRCAA